MISPDDFDLPTAGRRRGVCWELMDDLLGEAAVRANRRDGVIEIDGVDAPLARLLRTGDGMVEPGSLIGTREAGRLALTVGDRTAEVTPGKGVLIRRSFRVDVRVDGVAYRLAPDSARTSVLLRDGVRIGRLTADPDAMVLSAEWFPDAPVSPADAVIGHLLAVSFGTGAPHPVHLLWDMLLFLPF